MRLPDTDMAALAVRLQACLLACGDEGRADALANDVPWQRAADSDDHRRRLAIWIRRAMALLATRLDEIPEDASSKEANRRLADISSMAQASILYDPVLGPMLPDSDRPLIEEGMISVDEAFEAVERGMAGGGRMNCAECGTVMAVMFSSIQCPSCGSHSVQS